jgi:hypothetical protein
MLELGYDARPLIGHAAAGGAVGHILTTERFEP